MGVVEALVDDVGTLVVGSPHLRRLSGRLDRCGPTDRQVVQAPPVRVSQFGPGVGDLPHAFFGPLPDLWGLSGMTIGMVGADQPSIDAPQLVVRDARLNPHPLIQAHAPSLRWPPVRRGW